MSWGGDVETELIVPGSRRLSDAKGRLRPVAILDAATAGSDHQPTEEELNAHIRSLRAAATWRDLFPGLPQSNWTRLGLA
jgi:hypothetical protein